MGWYIDLRKKLGVIMEIIMKSLGVILWRSNNKIKVVFKDNYEN